MAYDPSIFEARRRALTQQYGASAAMNAYQQYLARQAGQRQMDQYGRESEAQLRKLSSAYSRPASMGGRGLYGMGIRSGVYNRALSEYGTEVARQRGYLTTDLDTQQREYELRSNQLLSNLQSQLTDLESEKARQIAADAAALLSLR